MIALLTFFTTPFPEQLTLDGTHTHGVNVLAIWVRGVGSLGRGGSGL
jgi:hypothetical protein